MNNLFKSLFFTDLILLFFSCNKKDIRIQTGGSEIVSFKVLPFEIRDVKLLDGYFKHATQLNVQSLLNYEPDRLLSKFRSEAGLKPKAEHYHGWEDNTIAGHSLGHYLSACALMYQTTENSRFLDRINYMIDELEECQLADGSGYIGAFPNGKKILEDEVAKGDIRAKGFDLNGIWVPYYTQHKIMAGLFDAFDLFNNESWKIHQAAYREKLELKKQLEVSTIDFSKPEKCSPNETTIFKTRKHGWEKIKTANSEK